MATRYVITATANHPEKTMANPKSALATAKRRCEQDNEAVYVKTEATGKIVDTLMPATATPAPKAAKAAKAAPKKEQGARRQPLRTSAVTGWDVLYDKPRDNAEVVREAFAKKPKYALLCTKHNHLRELARLTQERTLRANGGWCPKCTKAAAK